MKRGTTATAYIRRFLTGLMLLPFVLFSFYAVGTMPTYGEQGIKTVICSGTSIITVYLDENGEPVEETVVKHCDWSSSFHLFDTTDVSTHLIGLNTVSHLTYNVQDNLVSDLRMAGYIFARAPPASI